MTRTKKNRARSLLGRLLPACLLLAAACGGYEPGAVESSLRAVPAESSPASETPIAPRGTGVKGSACSTSTDCGTGLLCCYPCGANLDTGCQKVCTQPDPRTKRCPLYV